MQNYYYYPQMGQQDPYVTNAMASMYMRQPQDPSYLVPMAIPPAVPGSEASVAAGNMFAHESNGMVYYYDSAQVMGGVDAVPAMSYSMSTGGLTAPGEDGFSYGGPTQAMVYYPSGPS